MLNEEKYENIFSPQTLSKLDKQSQENLKDMLGDKTLMQTMISSQKLIDEIIAIEAPYKEQLEQLAIEMVEQIYPIVIDENIYIDAKIISMTDVGNSLDESITPEGRRRVINGISQGAALRGTFSFYLFKEYIEAIDESLIQKYNELLKNTFGVYDDKNAVAMFLSALAQGQKSAGGSSKVIINEIKIISGTISFQQKEIKNIINGLMLDMNDPFNKRLYNIHNIKELKSWLEDYCGTDADDRNTWPDRVLGDLKIIKENNESGITIQAKAICFPMLVHEIIKGLYELVGMSGFKGNKEENQQIVDKVDTLSNEVEDLQKGKFIYDALNNIFADSKYNEPRIREYFFQEVYQLDDQEFIELIENSINENMTSSQIKWVDQTLREINQDLKDDEYDKEGIDEVKVISGTSNKPIEGKLYDFQYTEDIEDPFYYFYEKHKFERFEGKEYVFLRVHTGERSLFFKDNVKNLKLSKLNEIKVFSGTGNFKYTIFSKIKNIFLNAFLEEDSWLDKNKYPKDFQIKLLGKSPIINKNCIIYSNNDLKPFGVSIGENKTRYLGKIDNVLKYLQSEKDKLNESKSQCWDGYKKVGVKKKGDKTVNNCIPIKENNEKVKCSNCGWEWDLANGGDDSYICHKCGYDQENDVFDYSKIIEFDVKEEEEQDFLQELKKTNRNILIESKYQGRTVQLNKPMQGDSKKFKVFVKNKDGKVLKVNFGAKGMNIKKNNPKNKNAYCSRSKGIEGGGKDKTKANYWSRKAWSCNN